MPQLIHSETFCVVLYRDGVMSLALNLTRQAAEDTARAWQGAVITPKAKLRQVIQRLTR